MIQQLIKRWRQILPHGLLEQTGVLLWVMGVLVIGLRVALTVPDQPVFRQVLQIGATILLGIALTSGIFVMLIVVMRLIRSHVRSSAERDGTARVARDSQRRSWRSDPKLHVLAPLCVDSLLAAAIVHGALDWAAHSRLSVLLIAQLVVIGLIHIALAVVYDLQRA